MATGKATIGKTIPDLSVTATGGKQFRLSELRGQNVVIYFYPRDNTSGCTTEGLDFKASKTKFGRRNTIVLGVSRDSLKSHENFKSKHEFPFDLISDENERLCKVFDVIKEKNMYGKKVLGIERSTFIMDADGVLRQEFRKVKVAGHVNAVLEAVLDIDGKR
ncbi:MAG: peroxiredoxin [Acidiferrobacterales bacterium]